MKLKGLIDHDDEPCKNKKYIRPNFSEDVTKLSAGDYKRLAVYILDAVDSMDEKFSKHSSIREGLAVRQKIMDNFSNLTAQEKNQIFRFNRTITAYADVSDRNKLEINDTNMIEILIIFATLYLVNDINTANKLYGPGCIGTVDFKKREDEIILLRGYLDALKECGRNIRTDSVDRIIRKFINLQKKFIRTCYFTIDPGINACRDGFFKTLLDAGIVSICVDLRDILESPKNVCCTFYVYDDVNAKCKYFICDGNGIRNDVSDENNRASEIKSFSNTRNKIKQPPKSPIKSKKVVVYCPSDTENVLDFSTLEQLISFIRNGGLNF